MSKVLMALFNKTFRRRKMETLLHEMHYKDGELNAVMEFPGVGILADEIGNMFDKAGGVNYVEFTVFNIAKMRTFVVTVQRKGGKTQGQIIDELRAEIASLREAQP